MAFGVLCVRRYSAVLRAEKQRRADQLRRVQDYRLDDSRAHYLDARREPYIGKTSDRPPCRLTATLVQAPLVRREGAKREIRHSRRGKKL